MSECNKCNGTLFVCENHPDQKAHQCKHCGGAGMLCECTKISEPIGNTKQLPIRWMHINGTVIKVENPDDFDMRFFIPLYTHPMRKLTDEEYEKIMKQWDYWRKQIAEGNKSSAPRDWFEGVIDDLLEVRNET